jgi:predicted nucleotidyltransferase
VALQADSRAAGFRDRLSGAIVAALRDDQAVRAVGEGGAAARGRADRYSDLDLMVVAELSESDRIFGRVEDAVRSITSITHVWIVDPPGFADMAQRIYFVEGAPPYFAIDCSVITPSGVVPFLERERHGEAVVGFDRDGALRPRALDAAALAQRRAHRLTQLRGSTPVYSMLIEKELARGHTLEAYGFYQALLRALIELLGMQHRPDRFDFGWRYVERELPASAQGLIARHAFVADASVLPELASSLVREIDRQLDSLTGAG